MQNEPTEAAWHRIHFKNIQRGTNIQAVEKVTRCSSNKASLIKFLVEEWKKTTATGKKLEGQGAVWSHVSSSASRSPKSSGRRGSLSLSQVKKKSDTRLFSMHLIAAESWVPKSVIITAEDTQDVMGPVSGHGHKIPSHLFQKVRDEEPDKSPLDITHTEPLHWGASRV
ncbi:hypothetical protein GWK47_012869 [Chionoecetes opilio]|uniref:Uncharacterized protein n=1 Tax=Chionoecetes opilio TaxID=41210 RepID=A0A8J4Y1L4_CHIOP|nr:hypothetical protein GWK47_012869 [Chionoecetes opilio]